MLLLPFPQSRNDQPAVDGTHTDDGTPLLLFASAYVFSTAALFVCLFAIHPSTALSVVDGFTFTSSQILDKKKWVVVAAPPVLLLLFRSLMPANHSVAHVGQIPFNR